MKPTLLAVPNISEGRDRVLVERIAGTDGLLDIHTDPDHNRSVLTYAGAGLVDACVQMTARAVAWLDIREHTGVHPRLGVVDVLPFVPYSCSEDVAVDAAREAARRIRDELDVPVRFYGAAGEVDLPVLRRRAPDDAHPSAGVVSVGVRGPLVAFNVDLRGPTEVARRIAVTVREPGAIRALAFPLASRGLVQVSMNLIDPLRTGPLTAFGRVSDLAYEGEVDVVGAEVVGLVPDELLVELDGLPLHRPARGIEEALGG